MILLHGMISKKCVLSLPLVFWKLNDIMPHWELSVIMINSWIGFYIKPEFTCHPSY